MFSSKPIVGDFNELFIRQVFTNVALRSSAQKDRTTYYYCDKLKNITCKDELQQFLEYAQENFRQCQNYSVYLKIENRQTSRLYKEAIAEPLENHQDNHFEFYKHINDSSAVYIFTADNSENILGAVELDLMDKPTYPISMSLFDIQSPTRHTNKLLSQDPISSVKPESKALVSFSQSTQSQSNNNGVIKTKKRKRLIIPKHLIFDPKNSKIPKLSDENAQKKMSVVNNGNNIKWKRDFQIDRKLYSRSEISKNEYIAKKKNPKAPVDANQHIFSPSEYALKQKLLAEEKKKMYEQECYNERNILQVRTMTKYMNLIRDGKKTKEARIKKNIFTKVKKDDIICFFNDYDTTVFCVVKKVSEYQNFSKMFSKEKIHSFLPNLQNFELKTAIETYYSFKNYEEQEKRFGVVCFELDNNVPQEKEYYYS